MLVFQLQSGESDCKHLFPRADVDDATATFNWQTFLMQKL